MNAQKEPGWKIGKYEVRALIGRGGFGTVYRAYDTRLEVERAIKILHPTLNSSSEFITRFSREARLVARMDSAYIVPVYDFGHEDARYFLVMKLMPGGSLSKMLEEQGAPPYKRALQIVRDTAAALDYAHSEGLVHRDIKPGNVLFEENGTARLGDFGFARALSGGEMSSLSLSGGLMGTPSYMAPELWRNQLASPASDVYALGCMVTEMLTGVVLFSGESPAEIMTSHVLDGPQFPQQWPADVPQGMEAVLKKALERKPEDRFQSAGDFYQALRDCAQQPAQSAEQERQAAASSLRAEALEAKRVRDWSAAEAAVEEWLKIAPGDAEALAMQVDLVRRRQKRAEDAQRSRVKESLMQSTAQTGSTSVQSPSAAAPPAQQAAPVNIPVQEAVSKKRGLFGGINKKGLALGLALSVVIFAGICLAGYGLLSRGVNNAMADLNKTSTAEAEIIVINTRTAQFQQFQAASTPVPADTEALERRSNDLNLDATLQARSAELRATIDAMRGEQQLSEFSAQQTQDAMFQQAGSTSVEIGKLALSIVNANWQQLAFDGFDNNLHGWTHNSLADEYGERAFFVEDGRYSWEVNSRGDVNYWVYNTLPPVLDFYTAVDITILQENVGAEEMRFGFVLWENASGLYVYRIISSGHFRVDYQDFASGGWFEVLGWQQTGALNANGTNRVGVLSLNDIVWLYINDQYVGQFQNTLSQSGTLSPMINLIQDGDSALVVFDNFELRVP